MAMMDSTDFHLNHRLIGIDKTNSKVSLESAKIGRHKMIKAGMKM